MRVETLVPEIKVEYIGTENAGIDDWALVHCERRVNGEPVMRYKYDGLIEEGVEREVMRPWTSSASGCYSDIKLGELDGEVLWKVARLFAEAVASEDAVDGQELVVVVEMDYGQTIHY